ncbi:MAG TPA: hypothetical protein VFT22_21985 [Kofleriaceae bacterium]|nr:hypothetical protein [Kofleriaceae bacterium]
MILILALGCQGSLTLNGRPVQLIGSNPPPSPAPPPGQLAPPPPPPGPPPHAAASAPARDDEDGGEDDAAPAPAPPAPPPAMAAAPFHRKPKPSEDELDRLGRSCYARKAAACRELALIYFREPTDTSCGTYLTNDPNGPIGRAGRVEQPACKPPRYRHLGACGMCELPTIRCEPGEGGPFGHKSNRCPAGELCSINGACFPRAEFPVEHHNLPRGETCYLDRECASQKCPTDGSTAYGRVGNCT